MNYVLDAILVIVSLALLVGGLRRGPLAEGLTLGAILLGALLMAEWGNVWGTDLGEQIALGSAGLDRFVVWLALLLVPTLVIGYGGALLLPALQPMRIWQRLLGGLLGLANGMALGAFVLRAWYYTAAGVNPANSLLADPLTAFFLNWAGWWPLALLAVGIGAVLAGVLAGALRPRKRVAPMSRPVPVTTTTAAPSAPSQAAPTQAVPIAPPISGNPVTPPRPAPVVADRPAPAPASSAAAPPVPRPSSDGPGTAPAPAATPNGTGVKRCLTCGKVLPPGAAFCTNCGTPVEA
jgi:hypothetical protein